MFIEKNCPDSCLSCRYYDTCPIIQNDDFALIKGLINAFIITAMLLIMGWIGYKLI